MINTNIQISTYKIRSHEWAYNNEYIHCVLGSKVDGTINSKKHKSSHHQKVFVFWALTRP